MNGSMKSKKVSIIVPAYNSGDTLARCLGSLVHQTLDDIEIIVVNDASTDDTWEIMKRCQAQFPEKVVIVNGDVNRGSGGARNQGFDIATGEYIGLVDSDDFVAPNMYEQLFNKAKEGNYDIVDCGYYSEKKDTATIFTGDNVTGILDANKRNILISGGGYLVTKIFRRELFNDPPIRMREHIRCLEDTEILIYMFLRAKKIGNVKEVLYNYCDTSGSATKDTDFSIYLESVMGAMQAVFDVCHRTATYEVCIESIEYAIINMYSYGVNRCLYDHIREYGADCRNINKYFADITEQEKGMLHKIAKLKGDIVTSDYRDNHVVIKRISELDLLIMEECDRRFGNPFV